MRADPFEQEFISWLHGVHLSEQARLRERNVNTLINTLQERGHRISYSGWLSSSHILVDEETPLLCTITWHEAEDTPPEELLQWVEREQASIRKGGRVK